VPKNECLCFYMCEISCELNVLDFFCVKLNYVCCNGTVSLYLLGHVHVSLIAPIIVAVLL
jgi:hypothetical protein